MNLEERIKFLEDTIERLVLSDRYAFQKHIQILDARNIQLGKGTGTIIGTEGYGDASPTDPGQKLGFYGTTPIVQQTAIGAPSGGVTVDSQARTAINSIISFLTLIGLTR